MFSEVFSFWCVTFAYASFLFIFIIYTLNINNNNNNSPLHHPIFVGLLLSICGGGGDKIFFLHLCVFLVFKIFASVFLLQIFFDVVMTSGHNPSTSIQFFCNVTCANVYVQYIQMYIVVETIARMISSLSTPLCTVPTVFVFGLITYNCVLMLYNGNG